MRRSKAVPLGNYGRRVASGVIVAGLAAVAAGCGDPNVGEVKQDAQPVCGREENGQVIVLDAVQCEDGDPDHDDRGGSVFFFHYPLITGGYPPGSVHPVSSSAFKATPSQVPRGYSAGTVKVGGFGTGANGGKAGGGGGGKGGSGGG